MTAGSDWLTSGMAAASAWRRSSVVASLPSESSD